MGEIADSIIDGEFCDECGCYIGEAVGFPRKCRECGRGRKQPKFKPLKRVQCPQCGRKFGNESARSQHIQDKHFSLQSFEESMHDIKPDMEDE